MSSPAVNYDLAFMTHQSVSVKKYIESNDDWGISKFRMSDLSEKVVQFNFVAHENPSNEGDKVGGKELPPTNHWTVFLSLSDNSSVEVDAAPNGPGEPGMVILESQNCKVTTQVTKRVEINPLKPITVADVFDLIIQKKRDHYVFAPVGEGCRFWLYTLADDFVGVGFISKAEAEQVQSALVMYWPYPMGTHPVERPMAKGYFPNAGYQDMAWWVLFS